MDISNNIIDKLSIEESSIEESTIQESSIEESNKDLKNSRCQELKNLEYKNVLMYGNNLKPQIQDKSDVSHIENILSQESELNRLDLWNKLDKTDKITKLNVYSKQLCKLYKLSDDETRKLNNYFIYCLDRKYLSKVKDVEYDRESGIINNIPNLIFNEESRLFTFKKNDKHVSTLKSLPPKKNKTAKQ